MLEPREGEERMKESVLFDPQFMMISKLINQDLYSYFWARDFRKDLKVEFFKRFISELKGGLNTREEQLYYYQLAAEFYKNYFNSTVLKRLVTHSLISLDNVEITHPCQR